MMAMLLLRVALMFVVASVDALLSERYWCGACLVLEESGTELCSQLDVCHLSKAARKGCHASGVCARAQHMAVEQAPASPLQLRVAKGHGTRPYGALRVSIITPHGKAPPVPFDYSGQFRYRWTQFDLHSSVLMAKPGRQTELLLGPANSSVYLPAQGDGVAGVLIADPCARFDSFTTEVYCQYAEKWQTAERTPSLLNAFLRHDDTAYWGVLGDNWYDRTGEATAKIYERLELSTLQKLMIAAPGNHDYWYAPPQSCNRPLARVLMRPHQRRCVAGCSAAHTSQ